MATIGNTTFNTAGTVNVNSAYIHNQTIYHLDVTTPQEAFSFNIYQNSSATGLTAELGIYEITNGVSTGVLVGAVQTFIGDGNNAVWRNITLTGNNRITLPVGKYAVCMWSDGWPIGLKDGYVSSNNLRDSSLSTLPAILDATSSPLNGGAISMYVDTVAGAFSTIIDSVVDGTNQEITDGSTNVTVTGTFEATQGSADVIISPTDNINDPFGASQVINTYSSTVIGITTNLPVTTDPNLFLYMFVRNDSGLETIPGFTFRENLTAPSVITLFTLELEDGASNPVICASTDFANGMTAYLNEGLFNEEIATIFSSNSSLDTSTPQYSAAFTKVPVFGVDTISIVYLNLADGGTGDIASASGGIALDSQSFNGTVC